MNKPLEAESQAIATIPERAPNIADRMMTLIERAASDPTFDAAKAKTFLEMQIIVMDKQAHIDFAEAKARIKTKLQGIKIVKNRQVAYDLEKGNKAAGQKEAFKYAALEDIDKIVGPMLAEEAISDSYTMEPIGSGWYQVTCRLSKGLHTEETKIPLPLDASGGKNNVQGAGSTFSYGRRYALSASIGLVVVGQDDDAAGGPITDEQAAELKGLLKEAGMDSKRFLKNMNAESVEEIKTKDHARALNSVQAYMYRKEQEAAKKKGANNV